MFSTQFRNTIAKKGGRYFKKSFKNASVSSGRLYSLATEDLVLVNLLSHILIMTLLFRSGLQDPMDLNVDFVHRVSSCQCIPYLEITHNPPDQSLKVHLKVLIHINLCTVNLEEKYVTF